MVRKNLKKEIESIKERNARVEADKAWEVSWTRRIIVALLTYLVIVLFIFVLNLPNPFISALIPTAGFLLSTLTVGFVKKIWLEKTRRK